MWTRDAARVLGWDGIGTLAPGSHADLIVVDRDPLALPARRPAGDAGAADRARRARSCGTWGPCEDGAGRPFEPACSGAQLRLRPTPGIYGCARGSRACRGRARR